MKILETNEILHSKWGVSRIQKVKSGNEPYCEFCGNRILHKVVWLYDYVTGDTMMVDEGCVSHVIDSK